jgi:hypothetical protein
MDDWAVTVATNQTPTDTATFNTVAYWEAVMAARCDAPYEVLVATQRRLNAARAAAAAARFAAHPKTEGWCEICSGEYDPNEYEVTA